jgi:hypothetical protein
MALSSKHEVAQILRREAASLRRHGFTNFFSHQYVCLLAQVLRPETCEGCLLGDYLPEEYRQEAFPCQHITQDKWEQIAQIPGLPEKVAARFEEIAAELEREASREEPVSVPPAIR